MDERIHQVASRSQCQQWLTESNVALFSKAASLIVTNASTRVHAFTPLQLHRAKRRPEEAFVELDEKRMNVWIWVKYFPLGIEQIAIITISMLRAICWRFLVDFSIELTKRHFEMI